MRFGLLSQGGLMDDDTWNALGRFTFGPAPVF